MKTRYAFLMVVLAAVVAATGLSQSDEDPGFLNVAIVEVQYGRIPDFEALQREMSGALKKADSPFRHVWQVARGQTNEFHVVSPMARFAEAGETELSVKAMGEAGFARWVARITDCIQARRVITLRPIPELSLPTAGDTAPNLIVLTTRDHLPGRGGDYGRWLGENYLPAARKAEVSGYFVYRSVFGANPRTWTTVSHVSDWAALDEGNPVRRALSDEEFATLVTAGGAMTSSPERLILRYRPELSIP